RGDLVGLLGRAGGVHVPGVRVAGRDRTGVGVVVVAVDLVVGRHVDDRAAVGRVRRVAEVVVRALPHGDAQLAALQKGLLDVTFHAPGRTGGCRRLIIVGGRLDQTGVILQIRGGNQARLQ